MKIPKQLFFIWIGENKPSYVDYTIDVFKDVNPKFTVDLIWEKDIFNTSNKDLIKCRDIVLKNDKNDERYGCHIKSRMFNTYLKNNTIQKICDIFRFELIYNYGGIYLDCDTFPVHEFDDELLSYESFCCESQFIITNRIIPDIFFLGCTKGNICFGRDINDYIYNKNHVKTINILDDYSNKFKDLKNKFFNCQLKYGEKIYENSLYIDHYINKKWFKDNDT